MTGIVRVDDRQIMSIRIPTGPRSYLDISYNKKYGNIAALVSNNHQSLSAVLTREQSRELVQFFESQEFEG